MITPAVTRVGEALDTLIAGGLEKAMNIFNRDPEPLDSLS